MRNNPYKNTKVPIALLDSIIIAGLLSLGIVLAFQF